MLATSGTDETWEFHVPSWSRDLGWHSGHLPFGYAARRQFGAQHVKPQTTPTPSNGIIHFPFRPFLGFRSSRLVRFELHLHSRHGRVETFIHLPIGILATAGLLERVSPLRRCRHTKDPSPQLLSAIGANASPRAPDVGRAVQEISCLVAPSGLLKRPAHASTRERRARLSTVSSTITSVHLLSPCDTARASPAHKLPGDMHLIEARTVDEGNWREVLYRKYRATAVLPTTTMPRRARLWLCWLLQHRSSALR